MQQLRQVVVGMGALSSSQLRRLRVGVAGMPTENVAKRLVLELIDLYLSVGDNVERRAAAAAACLRAIDEIEKRSGHAAQAFPGSAGGGWAGKVAAFAAAGLVVAAVAAGIFG